MYSKIRNVQIIVSLMKQHNIRHIVLSAGTRHVPIAHSVENDAFFKCYSVVDERSAGYYAIGIAKATGEKVAIACTSSTATCNYSPAVAEAFYQKIPLLILTGDRDPYRLGQLEDQMIDQVDMYSNYCKKCVNLPVVNNSYDEWYCSRLVNEAILELDHHGAGPVQINFPITQSIDDIADASVVELPKARKITRIDPISAESEWNEWISVLRGYKRIMVVCGCADPVAESTVEAMSAFAERFNCVFAVEKLSNLHFDGAIDTYLIGEAISGKLVETVIKPDLVILFGGNFISRWKTHLRGHNKIFTTWLVSPDGMVMDPLQNLSAIFECSPEYFFRRCADNSTDTKNDKVFYNNLMELNTQISVPDMGALIDIANGYALSESKIPHGTVSAFSAIYGLSQNIPENSILHLSILNSARIMQMFELPKGVEVHSNIGTDGIDGCMSTFLGQSAIANRECFLVIGDLSFFYDMNAASIRGIGGNVHILMINNGGGAEFYFSMGPNKLPNIDRHISAAHSHKAREWVEANGFTYMTASNQKEFDNQIASFVKQTDTPMFFEVFTDKQWDVNILKSFQKFIHIDTPGRNLARKIIGLPVIKQVLRRHK